MTQLKHKLVIEEFKRLLLIQSCDHDARTIYKEAGRAVFMSARQARRVIAKYYTEVITPDMVNFLNGLSLKNDGSRMKTEVSLFSKEFNVCLREARIFVTYINRRNRNEHGKAI